MSATLRESGNPLRHTTNQPKRARRKYARTNIHSLNSTDQVKTSSNDPKKSSNRLGRTSSPQPSEVTMMQKSQKMRKLSQKFILLKSMRDKKISIIWFIGKSMDGNKLVTARGGDSPHPRGKTAVSSSCSHRVPLDRTSSTSSERDSPSSERDSRLESLRGTRTGYAKNANNGLTH